MEQILLEINSHFKNSNENYILHDTDVVNNQYRILVSCDNNEHAPYWVSWQHYKNRGDRCGKCRYINNGKRRLIYDNNRIKEIVNGLGYELIEIKSIGDEGKITIRTNEGYVIDTHLNNIMRGSNPKFFHFKNSYVINNIKLWCSLNNKSFILIDKKYCRASIKLKWKCLKCDEEFDMSWNTISNHLYECPYCSGRKASINNNLLKINPNLAKQWNYNKNYPIRPENVLSNTTKNFWWICNDCGYEWIKSVHYRNQKNVPCPICKMSKGEYSIKCYLDDNNIKYFYEYSFNNCKNVKNLRFDFYLPNNNICIEYQGEYHYKVLKGISNENILKIQKKCDKIKNNYCKLYKIKLIKIPYWKFKNIKNILTLHLLNERISKTL